MPELHMEARPPHPVPQSGRSHMQETFSPITVDLPAEILIPTLLYNPLPLQCLAADALPKQIKEEIDQITSEYGDMDSELLKVPASPTSTVETQEEDRTMLVLKRHFRNGYGLRFIGGVKCENGELHAQIMCVLPESVPKQLEPLKAGACIMSINGKSLTGATFEQVKLTLDAIEKEVIEVTYRTCCSKPIEVVRRHRNDCRSSPQRKKKPPNFLPIKQPGSKKPRAKKATGRMSGLVPSPVTENTVSSSSNSGSVGPSSKCDRGGTIILNHPNNMIQISLRYNQQQEMFFVSLHKFNGHCSPSWLEQSGVFLNTYIIPNNQSLGVRHAMMVSPTASTDELLEQSASYRLSVSELKKYSLRLIVWESGRGLLSKKPILHGEVFLLLRDKEMINLHGVPQWYNVSPPDPNLPAVPKPYQLHKQPIDRVFNKMKSSLAVAQNAGTNTLRRMMKGSADSAKRSISLQNMSSMSSSPSNLSSILDTLRDTSATSGKPKSNTAPEEMTKAMFSFLEAYEDDDQVVSSGEDSPELSLQSGSSQLLKGDTSLLTTSDVHLSLTNAKDEETDLNRSSLLALIASLNHQENSADCSVHPSSGVSSEEESGSSLDSSNAGQRESNSWASPVLRQPSVSSWSHDETTTSYTTGSSLELHNPLLPCPASRFLRHRSQTVPVSSPQHQTDLDNSFRASFISSSPITNPLSCSSPCRIKQSISLGDMTDIDQQDDEDNVESSLDFPHHRRQQLNTEDHCTSLEQSGVTTPTQAQVITRKTEQKQLLSKSLESSCLETHSQTSIPTRWNSVDNLLNLNQPDSSSTRKKSWMQKIMFRRSTDNSINTGKKLAAAYSKGKPVGNIKVQLTATNHNAATVNVKVLSALFYKESTTNSSVVVKASTFSNITDTCEHKQKTLTKLQHNHELSPPSTFAFLANPQDYSLQIVLVQGTQVFGHKSYSHAWVNLSKILESGSSNQTIWLQLRKLPLSF